jgi:hypothetical protein
VKEEWQISEEIGALKHRLAALNCVLQPLAEERVRKWERQWGVTLPPSYRRFITEVADGLSMPRATLIPLEQAMATPRGNSWIPSQLPPDFLQKPFLPENDYNPDFAEEPKETAWQISDEDYALWWLQQLHGTMIICDHGNDVSTFLIVTGKACGEVWVDMTVNGNGYERADWDFLDWISRKAV